MAEYSRTTYNFNSRIILNDDTTDATKFVLVDVPSIADTISQNIERDRPDEPGIIDYGVKLSKGVVDIPLTLYASSQANMEQLIEDLKEAFNPDLLEADTTYGDSTLYNGYHPLDWTETVGSTERNFRMYVKSMETPIVEFDSLSGIIRKSKLKLKIEDPRKYLQTANTVTADGATATNAGTYPTHVTITVTATGTTSTSLQIGNGTTSKNVYVPTALTNGQALVIDTYRRSVKLNGTENKNYISGGSSWWTLQPGNNTIVFENNNLCTIQVSWRSAWPL